MFVNEFQALFVVGLSMAERSMVAWSIVGQIGKQRPNLIKIN